MSKEKGRKKKKKKAFDSSHSKNTMAIDMSSRKNRRGVHPGSQSENSPNISYYIPKI